MTDSESSDPIRGPRVYVDARIEGRDKKEGPKTTAVGFVVEERPDLDSAKILDASESDDAELHAVYFAIQQLKDTLPEFTIVCDHDSVVSIINRNSERAARKRPVLSIILNEKRTHPGIKFDGMKKNPAHRFLKKWFKEHPTSM